MKPEDAHWKCPEHALIAPSVSGRAVAPLCHRPPCDYKTTMVMVHSFGCDGTHEVGTCNRLAVPAKPEPMTTTPATTDLDPERVVDALMAIGWTHAGQRTGLYKRLLWPNVTDVRGRSILIPLAPDRADYDSLMGDAIASLEQAAEVGRNAAAALAAINGTEVERDAAREELAKTRAELDRIVQAVRFVHAEYEGRCVTCEERCDCLDLDDMALVGDCTHGNAEWPCTTIQQLNSAPEANPATTAEPADEPFDCAPECRCKTTKSEPAAKQPITARWPRIPGNDTVALHDCGGDPKCCGTPGDHDAAEPADEPKAVSGCLRERKTATVTRHTRECHMASVARDLAAAMEDDDEPACGHDRAKADNWECPECGADLAVLDDADATPAQVQP